jgi:hypothetical protein
MTQDSNQKSQATSEKNPSRLIPLVDWPKYHPWPPLGGLRHLVFHKETNGFAKCVKKCGRRVLIDEKEFFKFVDEQNRGRPE